MIERLTGPVPQRVIGMDTSTHSIAFCLMERGDEWSPTFWGKVYTESDSLPGTLGNIGAYLPRIFDIVKPDFACIESPVFVNSKVVTIKLSKVVGMTTGSVELYGVPTREVTPITWMNYIGNPTRDSKAFKDDMRKSNPGKPRTWYKQESRRLRKDRTRQWVIDTFGIELDDDDVTDAFGLAWYGAQELA